jgi:hypothetical protein
MGKKTILDLEELLVKMSASIDGITAKLSNME